MYNHHSNLFMSQMKQLKRVERGLKTCPISVYPRIPFSFLSPSLFTLQNHSTPPTTCLSLLSISIK